jgi:SHS2 domain-containing protein
MAGVDPSTPFGGLSQGSIFVMEPEEIPVPGVLGLDHTADVALEVRAGDLPELFRRAALATVWLLLERLPGSSDPGAYETRSVELVDEELSGLLRSWLRTILFWDETDGFVPDDPNLILLPAPLCGSETGQAFGLKASASGILDRGLRIREIKGVTLHGLTVERRGEEWFARVVFDV